MVVGVCASCHAESLVIDTALVQQSAAEWSASSATVQKDLIMLPAARRMPALLVVAAVQHNHSYAGLPPAVSVIKYAWGRSWY